MTAMIGPLNALRALLAGIPLEVLAEEVCPRYAQAIERLAAAMGRLGAPTERVPQVIVERVEVPVLQPQQIKTLQELMAGLRAVADDISAALAKARGLGSAPAQREVARVHAVSAHPAQSIVTREAPPTGHDRDHLQLRPGARCLLQTLAQRYPMKMTRAQLGTLARFTPSGGTFGTYFATLKRHGLLTETGQGDVEITAAGLAYLGSDIPPAPHTTAEVLAMWRQALRAGAWRHARGVSGGLSGCVDPGRAGGTNRFRGLRRHLRDVPGDAAPERPH
jgi:hypothetical protein